MVDSFLYGSTLTAIPRRRIARSLVARMFLMRNVVSPYGSRVSFPGKRAVRQANTRAGMGSRSKRMAPGNRAHRD